MGQFLDVKWPAEYNELTRIEDLLHCRICYEYIETCVVTPCSHNYCSMCIRKFLHYKTQCPICFENVYEKDLHPNRILDEFIESFFTLREKLFSCIKGVEVKQLEHMSEKSVNLTPVKPKTPVKNVNSSFETPRKLFRDDSAGSSKSFHGLEGTPIAKNQTPHKLFNPSPSTSDKTPKKNFSFVKKNEDNSKTEINRKRVPCPVCGIEISEININKHLDDCLKRQKSMSPLTKQTAKNSLQPLPKYVVNLMKDSELRKVLKKYGLSTSGVRKTLEKRLQKFSILYNVERDKASPRSMEDLVKLCDVEENAEKNIFKQNSSDLTLNIDRKTDSTLIEKVHKQYLEKNKDDYQKLIESIKEREKGKTRSSQSLLGFNIEEDSVATTSSMSHSSIFNHSDENNDTRSSIADASFYHLHDTSNSTNASYPLQHYSNEDPMRFLALEMSSDSQRSPLKFNTGSSSERDTSTGTKSQFDVSKQSDEIPSSNSTFFEHNIEGTLDDIYDLSTEDNCSDSCSKESTINKEKKVFMKRTKVDEENYSTDSETDIEANYRCVSKKTARKKNAKGNGEEKHKTRNDEDVEIDSEPSSNLSANFPNESKDNKENVKAVDNDDSATTLTRRSTRKRNHVLNYATSSKIAKVTGKNKAKNDDKRIGYSKNPRHEPLQENLPNIQTRDESNERDLNPRKKSLRKRGKL